MFHGELLGGGSEAERSRVVICEIACGCYMDCVWSSSVVEVGENEVNGRCELRAYGVGYEVPVDDASEVQAGGSCVSLVRWG